MSPQLLCPGLYPLTPGPHALVILCSGPSLGAVLLRQHHPYCCSISSLIYFCCSAAQLFSSLLSQLQVFCTRSLMQSGCGPYRGSSMCLALLWVAPLPQAPSALSDITPGCLPAQSPPFLWCMSGRRTRHLAGRPTCRHCAGTIPSALMLSSRPDPAPADAGLRAVPERSRLTRAVSYCCRASRRRAPPGSTLLVSLRGCAPAGPRVSMARQGSVWLLGMAAPARVRCGR